MTYKYIQLYDADYGGSIQLLEELPKSKRMNRFAILSRTWESVTIFGEERKYIPKPSRCELPQKSPLQILLVQFYKDVSFSYDDCGEYQLDEIIEKILKYVECDDDILTQFLDGEEIKKKLKIAKTFNDILTIIDEIYGSNEALSEKSPL